MSSYWKAGAPTGQPQSPFNFPSSIPIKKRRFPILRPSSPPEENISGSKNNESKDEQESEIFEINESKNQQESKIQDVEKPSLADERNAYSRGKASGSTVKEDVGRNTDLRQPNVENLASKPHEGKSIVNIISGADLGNHFDLLSNEKSAAPEVPKICMHSQAANVKENFNVQKTEGTCGVELSMDSMSVELSLGRKEPAVSSLGYEEEESICIKPGTSDPSLLSLALRDKKFARLGKIDCMLNEVTSQVCPNRSNWDLNTTMDVWEGSTGTDAFTDTPADVGGFGKTDNFQDERLYLATAETIGPNLDKGKCILDVSESNSSNVPVQQSSQQCRTDYALGLRLAMPLGELNVRKEHFSLSHNSVSHSSGLQEVKILDANVNRPVKSEPIDEKNKHDCSMGSNSSSNVVGSLKSYMKTEFVNKSIHSGKSMPSESVHLDNQNARESDDITMHQSISRPGCSADKISRPDDIGNLGAANNKKQHKLARADEDTFELDKNKPARMTEEGCAKSGWGSQWNCDVGISIDKGEIKCSMEDEEYEDGEVREPIQFPDGAKQIGVEKEMETSEYKGCAYRNLQPWDDYGPKDSANEIIEETHNHSNVDRISTYSESNSLQKALAEGVEGRIDERRAISVTPCELLEDCNVKEISIDGPAELVKETCWGDENNNSTLSNAEEASLDGHDTAKGSSSAENKSRIINLSRASAVTSPCRIRSNPRRLLPARSEKERDELYTSGLRNKFTKHLAEDQDQDQDQPRRYPRSSFSNRRGRISGRFGSLHGDWDPSDYDFASEIPYSPSDYKLSRRKYASEIHAPFDRRKPINGKFMRHLSDDIINPSYNNREPMYNELDGQKKSWRGSPSFYRTRKMRSPDRLCFYDEMVPRRLQRAEKFKGHGPYRFCWDWDGGFVERGSGGDGMREREFEGQVKLQNHRGTMGLSRRIRNVDGNDDDGSYGSVEGMWGGDGFSDGGGKRRRF